MGRLLDLAVFLGGSSVRRIAPARSVQKRSCFAPAAEQFTAGRVFVVGGGPRNHTRHLVAPRHPGPFTVFAPTDAAFAKVPKAQLDALLADKTALTKVLTYHVVPGKVMAKDVKAGKVKTVQGAELTLATAGGVTVDGAKVSATDIVADNGVIHVIDSVVMPK